MQGGIKKRDYISNANQHTRSHTIINEDISNFYPSISRKNIDDLGIFADIYNWTIKIKNIVYEG